MVSKTDEKEMSKQHSLLKTEGVGNGEDVLISHTKQRTINKYFLPYYNLKITIWLLLYIDSYEMSS